MIKRLAACIREFKKPSLLTSVTVSLEVVMEVLIPYITASLIDKGIEQANMPVILKYGIILVVSAFLVMLFGFLAAKYAATASAGLARNLRHDMYYNIQNFSFTNIDKYSTGGIVTRLTTDVNNVTMAYQMIIRMAVRSPMMIIWSFVFAARISLKLSLIFFITLPILAAALLLIMKFAHPLFQRVFKTYDKLNEVVEEDLRGIRVVKSFTREDTEKAKFGAISNRIYADFTRAEKILALNNPVMQGCMYATVLILAWFGAKVIAQSGGNGDIPGGLSVGQLASLITYASQILTSLMMVSMAFVMITMSKASAERVVEILDEKSDIVNPESPIFEVKDGSVEFTDVDFSYSKDADKKCLDNVNVKIASGETVGIIGGTGSSKSTFVSLIPRLYDVLSGSVKVGGEDVRAYDITTLRDNVAMVLQKNELFSGTIKENLRWGNPEATDEDIERVCRLACADEFIQTFPEKYDTLIDQGGANVSGGQKQRLCIARALLKKPKILILDDSTSAVDTRTDALIRKAFREEIPHTTKFIIAQRISSVQDADKIIVLDDGKISACGNHEYLLENSDVYREVYNSQVKGGDKE